MPPKKAKCVVTGGGGFLGKALCNELVNQGYEVTSISRGEYPELISIGVHCIQADVSSDLPQLISAFQGAECVFHTAAKVAMWGKYEDFFKTNVIGTRNVLQACSKSKVQKLVFTSSPSVVASGKDLRGVNESIPYPQKYDAFYPETKAQAEREVLEASSDEFFTISLRPHLIFGPGDTSLEALVVKRARQKRLVRIGSGKNLADFSFIDDCVAAHIRAYHSLSDNETSRGKAYFISQGIPIPLWDWIDAALKRNGLPPVSRSVPAPLAKAVGTILELLARYSPIPFEPPFTKFLAEEMATDHYFDITAAIRDLGYRPEKKDLLHW